MDRPWPAATAGAAPVRPDAHSQQGASCDQMRPNARPRRRLRRRLESAGKRVDWHGDYESLGPFAFDGVASIQNHDFVSVHFNLTADGGSLATLDWPLVSTLHHFVIVKWGIYSRPHKLLNFLSRPLFWFFARTRPNTVGVGNSFDNMRLHSVGAGAARLSYVVRLVRRNGGVTMSPATVATCASRRSASDAFESPRRRRHP